MNHEPETDEIRDEYDFANGVRGKHHLAYESGTNVVLLDPEVARVLHDSASVNRALKMLIGIAAKEVPKNETSPSDSNV